MEYTYREMVGCFLHIYVRTRPDIAPEVTELTRFVFKPRTCHWEAQLRVLIYVTSTREYGLLYTENVQSNKLFMLMHHGQKTY